MVLPDVLDPTAWLTNEEPAWLRAWQPVSTAAALTQAGGEQAVRLGGRDYVLVDVGAGPAAYVDDYAYRKDPRRLRESLPVAVCYGLVWLAPLGSVSDIPQIPEWDDPAFTIVAMAVVQWNASAAQMADNFLDVAHFPFTHPGSIGDPDDRVVLPYEVEREPWHFTVEHRHAAKTLSYSMGVEGTFGTTMRTLRFVGTAPHHVYLRIRYEDSGTVIVICFFHQAVDRDSTNLYAFQIRNDMGPGGYTVADVQAQQEAVANEDRVLLEQFAVNGIPVRLGDELHVRADRNTLELRRLLGDLIALDPHPDA